MKLSNNQQAFLELVRSGLWEKDVQLSSYGDVNFKQVYLLAQEQCVVGLVAAGIEHVKDVKFPKDVILTFVGETLQLEQRNNTMNHFLSVIVDQMRNSGVYALLLKGQGIAQCYERPQWRASGDVDFFLSESNYQAAKSYLTSLASHVDEENVSNKHLAMTIDPWTVELHGSLRGGLWKRVDRVLGEIHNDIFCGGAVRSWMNGKTQVFLPRADEDVVYVLSHILQHFFKEGVGLRQICDWCRLLWIYRDSINQKLLENRLNSMGLKSEWKTFSALAVSSLGMPTEAIPFYSSNPKWEKKANKVLAFIIETGSFGHNRDYSYYKKYPYFIYKTISLWKHLIDGYKFFGIFPLDSIKVTINRIREGFSVVLKGI